MGKDRPTLAQKAKNLSDATDKHIADGRRMVNPDQFDIRISVCNDCGEWRDGIECTHPSCGCIISRKAEWHSEDCPVGKWPEI